MKIWVFRFVSAVLSENDDRGSPLDPSLPVCLLAAPKLKQTEAVGAGHHTLADTMKRRIVLWCLGRFTQLWDEAKALQTPPSTHSISDEFQKAYNTRRSIKLAEEGAYSKATQALRFDGILPPSQEVTAALLGKHPQEPPGLDVDYEKPASLRHTYEFQRVR